MRRIRLRQVIVFGLILAATAIARGTEPAPPPLPETPEPPAVKFARRDAKRLAELAATVAKQAKQAAKKAAPLAQAVKKAEAAKAAAEKTATATDAAVKKGKESKAAADKALAAAQEQVQALEAQLKAARKTAEKASVQAQETAEKLTQQLAEQKQAAAAKAEAEKALAQAKEAAKPALEAQAEAEKRAKEAQLRADAAAARAKAISQSAPAPNPQSIRLVATFQHDRPVFSCRIDPLGEFVFAGSFDNNMQRWDLFTSSHTVLEGHRSWVRRFALDASGETLVTGAYGGKLIWWNPQAEKPEPIRTVDAHKGYIRAVAISPDGQYVVTGGNDNLVKVWSMADGSLIRELPGHERHVYNVAFHPSGKSFISGDLMGVLKEWEVGSWKHLRDFDSGVLVKYDKTFRADCGGIRSMDFSPDGQMFVVAGISDVTNAFAGVGTPTAVLFDWKSGKRLKVMKPKGGFRGTCWGVRFHPSGRFIIGAGGGTSGALWFWKPTDEESFFNFKLPQVAYDVALHPDGLRLAVGLFDKTVRIYDMSPKLDGEKVAKAK